MQGMDPACGTRLPLVHTLPLELLCAVFDELGGRDLTTAALVCRRWSVQAVHVKWSTHDVPFGALLTILGDVTPPIPPSWERSPLKTYAIEGLSEPLDPERQVAFKARASIITSLLVEFRLSSDLSSIVQSIFACRKDGFGRLKRLHTVMDPSAPVDEFLPFLAPTVESLTLEGNSPELWSQQRGSMTDSLEEILQRCPHIHHVNIECYFSGCLDFILAVPSLRSAEFYGVCTMGYLSELATHAPGLTDLKLSGSVSEGTTTIIGNVGFPSLQVLDISDLLDEDSLPILEEFRLPVLRKLNLMIDDKPIPTSFLQNVVNWSPGLESLILEYSTIGVEEPFKAISNLALFKQLRILYIDVTEYDPENSATMAGLVPQGMCGLEDLTLTCQTLHPIRPMGVSIRDLVQLATETKKLRRIETTLNAVHAPDDSGVACADSSDGAPHVLELILSPLFMQPSHAEIIAGLLRRAFPGVSTFRPTIKLCTSSESVDRSGQDTSMGTTNLVSHFFNAR